MYNALLKHDLILIGCICVLGQGERGSWDIVASRPSSAAPAGARYVLGYTRWQSALRQSVGDVYILCRLEEYHVPFKH